MPINEGFNSNVVPATWSKSGDFWNGSSGTIIVKGTKNSSSYFQTPEFSSTILGEIRMTAREYQNGSTKYVEVFAKDENGNWSSLGKKSVTNYSYWSDFIWNITTPVTQVKFVVTSNNSGHSSSKIYVDKVVIKGLALVCNSPS
jgi:hypothetical protein